MEGSESKKGVNYRALKSILDLSKDSDEFKTDVQISMLEVYNENIRDLLSIETAVDDSLDIRIGKQGTYVDMLSEWPVRCIEEAISILDRGSSNRQNASNNINERSSRSHLVVIIKVIFRLCVINYLVIITKYTKANHIL
jgi:kinesin family protein C2/C3